MPTKKKVQLSFDHAFLMTLKHAALEAEVPLSTYVASRLADAPTPESLGTYTPSPELQAKLVEIATRYNAQYRDLVKYLIQTGLAAAFPEPATTPILTPILEQETQP